MRFVVKLGGELISTAPDGPARPIARSLKALAAGGHEAVVVHGGGPQATALQKRLGLEPHLVGGRRVTDAETLEVMKMVLGGRLSSDLCAAFAAEGVRAVGLHGGSGVVNARRRPPRVVSGGGPEPVDFGLVGDVVGFDLELLHLLASGGRVPVIASLGLDPEAGVLNINADVIAAHLARSLPADALVLVTSAPGVLRDVDDPASRLGQLTEAEARAAIRTGVIAGGMIPKVEEALGAVRVGVPRVVIVGALGDGDLERALLEPGAVGTTLRA
jgi:acetylglutamate kinase